MNQIDRVKILYGKYLARTASPEEMEELFVLLRNRSEFEELQGLFEKEWESVDVTFSGDNLSWEQIQTDIHRHHQESSSSSVRSKKGLGLSGYWKYAAAIAILVLAGVGIWLFMSPVEIIYKTGYGETMEVVLDDGSRILLNANSTLIWYSDWQEAGERKAELTGEAYFDVSHQNLNLKTALEARYDTSNLMPFRVVTPDLTVNVLGTSFNVMTRRQKTGVFLKTGKVLLTLNIHEDIASKRHSDGTTSREMDTTPDSIYMRPGDYIRFSGQSRIMDRTGEQPSRDEPSWTEGFLTFENQQLNTVLLELEDIYGKTFVVQDTTLLKRIVNLGLPYEDWETVSGLMTLSLEIDMIQHGDQITIRKKQGK